jgi:hypothetical protein
MERSSTAGVVIISHQDDVFHPGLLLVSLHNTKKELHLLLECMTGVNQVDNYRGFSKLLG